MAIVTLTTACGGEKNTDEAKAADIEVVRTARIVPSVEGLTCTSGSKSSTTDAGGKFSIDDAEITCSIAGFKLPTLPKVANTRVHSATSRAGHIERQEYEIVTYTPSSFGPSNIPGNVTRFLSMIKGDDGTSISSQVRAANWAQYNASFDWNTDDLATAVASMQADAQSLDGQAHVLPSAEEGSSTASAVWQCAQTGHYVGELYGTAFTDPNPPPGAAATRSSKANIGVLVMPPFGALHGHISFTDAPSSDYTRGHYAFEYADGFPVARSENVTPTVLHYRDFDLEDPQTGPVSAAIGLDPGNHTVTGSLLGTVEKSPGGTLQEVDRQSSNTAPKYVFLHYPVSYRLVQGNFADDVLYLEIDAANNIQGSLNGFVALSRAMTMSGAVASDDTFIATRAEWKVEGSFDRDSVTLDATISYGGTVVSKVAITGCQL